MDINVEILIKGVGKLDINTKDSDEFGVPLIFNLSDIKDISIRKASFTKTIKILGTPNNNIIFNHLYEIKGQNFNFKITNKHNCSILLNKNPVMDGFLVLNKISKLLIGSKYEIVYEVNVFDEVKNFFDDIGQKELGYLDFSSGFTFNGINYDKGDHTFNIQDIGEQMRSQTDYTDIYDYPIIDYGYDLIGDSNYPYNITTSNGLLYPSIYQKAIIDKIFSESSNYSYESNYLDGISYGGFFKKMINVYNKGMDFNNIDLCEYVSSGSYYINDTSNVSVGKYVSVFDTYVENFYNIDDYLGNYSGTTGPQSPIDGNYIVKLKNYVIDDIGGTGLQYCAQQSYYQIFKYNIEEGETSIFYKSSSEIKTELGLDPETDTTWYYETSINVELVEGDILFVRLNAGTKCVDVDPPYQVQATLQGGISLELTYVRELDPVFSGTTTPYVYLNQFLPDMKQTDFIKEHIKLANLYIWSNKEDPKRLYIEPREDFYRQGEVINWTEKVDYNKSIVIKSLNSDIAKTFTFEYTLGDDVDNDDYNSLYYETYGSKIIDVDTNFLTNEQKVKLKHQSWFMRNKDGYIVPTLIEDTLHTWFDDKSSFEPMWGFMNNIQQSLKVGGYYRLNSMNGVINHIPYITHAKILGGLSFDLNYETNNETFTINDYDSSRGAYKIFWENYINNLIDEDARIVEMYINFDLADILNLDFRNRVLIDGQIYFLEKVEYDPTKKGSSKVTLLKEIDPIDEGSFDAYFILKNDLGDYITTSDGTDGLGDGGNKIPIN